MKDDTASLFDIDAIIEAKFSQIREPIPAGYSIENVLANAMSAQSSTAVTVAEPKTFQVTESESVPVPFTAIDAALRPLENTDLMAPGFAHLNDLTKTSRHEIRTKIGIVRFDGSALLCQCPDCTAPMTLRLWLRLADCWRCGSSVGLDEQTVAEVARAVASARQTAEPSLGRELPKPPPSPTDFFSKPSLETVAPDLRVVDPENAALVGIDVNDSEELARLTEGSFLAGLIRRMFRITPAWLVSFLLHLIALLVLAMILLGDQAGPAVPEAITLSTFLDSSDTDGGDVRLENPIDMLQDDVMLAAKMKLDSRELRKAASDAMELQLDPESSARLPSLEQVKKNITTRAGYQMSFAARDPRVRAEIVAKEGGTNLTEAAVSRGLRWLASVQNKDGSWSLKDYRRSDNPGNKGDAMGTALALLPFLGAGQTHEVGIYRNAVAGGLKWLLENQKSNGDLRGDSETQAGMYAHGQATIVLCEALALSGDRQFLEPARSAIKFIERAQHSKGGWRYRPGQAGDLSVFGWQMMALQSAKAAGMEIEINEQTFRLADRFLDSVSTRRGTTSSTRLKSQLPAGSTYAYQRGREATETMTAEAILCRMYLGWRKDDPRLIAAVEWLVANHLPSSRESNLYYWYYGTQVMHHFGGEPWEKWNRRLRSLLVATQETRGRYPGSWDPKEFEWGSKGGRIYSTAMAVCTLEVYYRHLPLFKQLELE